MDGRVAVDTSTNAWHAGFYWRHDPGEDALHIAGPFEQGAVDIVLQDESIRITEADGSTEVSDRPGELLYARLGVAVPLSALRYWVLGIPEPGHEHVARYDAHGRMRALKQEGWDIFYERYGSEDGWILPKKVLISRSEMKLKLVVDEWRLGPPGTGL